MKIERVDVPLRLEKRLAALMQDLSEHKGMNLNSCMEEILLHTFEIVGNGVASPQLMREAKYPSFTASEIYAQLYGPNSRYTNSLEFSKANEEFIIKHATDFYNSRN